MQYNELCHQVIFHKELLLFLPTIQNNHFTHIRHITIRNPKNKVLIIFIMSKPGNIWRKIHGKVTKKPTNFSWIIEEKLAGSGMPTSFEELLWVKEQGVKSIVTMTENALPENWIKDMGYLHVPTEDFFSPDIDQLEMAVDFIHEKITNNESIMVHCAAGKGRAGTVLACYLVKHHKYSAPKAIEKIRKERPGSIQSEPQELAIVLFEKHVRS